MVIEYSDLSEEQVRTGDGSAVAPATLRVAGVGSRSALLPQGVLVLQVAVHAGKLIL
jgi:hypothetical protein